MSPYYILIYRTDECERLFCHLLTLPIIKGTVMASEGHRMVRVAYFVLAKSCPSLGCSESVWTGHSFPMGACLVKGSCKLPLNTPGERVSFFLLSHVKPQKHGLERPWPNMPSHWRGLWSLCMGPRCAGCRGLSASFHSGYLLLYLSKEARWRPELISAHVFHHLRTQRKDGNYNIPCK